MSSITRTGGRVAEPGSATPDGDSSIARRRKLAALEQNPSWVARRRQILDAATEVFRAKGYRATAVSDIAHALHSDRANIYYYFAGKADIFLTLVQPAVEDAALEIEAAAEATGSPTDRLLRAIEALTDCAHRHFPYLHLFVQEDLRYVIDENTEFEHALRQGRDRYESALRRIIEAGARSGEFRAEVDPTLLRFAVMGAVNWTHRWFAPHGRMTGAEVGRAFGDIFLRGFAATPPEA
jgi:TetR/AcrR family transcriptional regulator, cholesterol catabolism regulator